MRWLGAIELLRFCDTMTNSAQYVLPKP